MRMYDLIMKKKQGKALSTSEIQFMIKGYITGEIPDYQMSAFLMAVCFCGMDERETYDLTMAMRDSGETLDLSEIGEKIIDKHSTGGVGDKTTLVLVPVVAALGVSVAKMSGRGLGVTGGTIDKLECFNGFNIQMSAAEFIQKVKEHHVAVTGQSEDLAPADKLLYALRDVTATVDQKSLIASSIMSKKLATGCDGIVLDVTYGSGAFMKDTAAAQELSEMMVSIAKQAGKQAVAVITNMNEPLGFAVGNALEIKEVIDTLNGNGPEDLLEVVYALGAQMMILAGKATDESDAVSKMKQVIASGVALEKLKELVTSQGGDTSALDDPKQLLSAKYQIEVKASANGYLSKIDALAIGQASMMLGGGRVTKESDIDLSVGVVLNIKSGETVKAGDCLAVVHSNREAISEIIEKVSNAFYISATKQPKESTVYKIITE